MAKKNKPMIDYGKIADGLGASAMVKLGETGLEVIFNTLLTRHSIGISPGGAVFFYRFLESYDLDKRRIVLCSGFTFGIRAYGDKSVAVFQSPKPDDPPVWVRSEMIVSITNLKTNRVLYPII